MVHRARDASTGVVFAERLRLAHTHWTRLKGLLGTRSLPAGDGLWLKPCNQIHMIGMSYAIDVLFLDGGNRVVRMIRSLAPGRLSPRVPDATSVIELPAGTIERIGLTEGARVEIEGDVPAVADDRIEAIGAAVCNILLAALYVFFAAVHVRFALKTGQWLTATPLVCGEAILVALFLTRRRSMATSARPFDWLVGIVGVFLPLLMRPKDPAGPLSALGGPMQVTGLVLAVVALVFLGRSIGVVAANRGIKTGGLYRVVRHPMYAAYILCYLGYVASYPSTWNCLIAVATLVALHIRAVVEERLLAQDSLYREYLRRVRWRFLPYVY